VNRSNLAWVGRRQAGAAEEGLSHNGHFFFLSRRLPSLDHSTYVLLPFFSQHSTPLHFKPLYASTMSGPTYRRVAQREGVSHTGSSDNLEANITRSRGGRLTDKLVASEYFIVLYCMRNVFLFIARIIFIAHSNTLYRFESFHFIQLLGLLSQSWSLDGRTFIRQFGVEANPIEICSPLPF
jgi:hypothetical protein